jgi:hypothetical protein
VVLSKTIRGGVARHLRCVLGVLLLALAWPSPAAAQGLFVVSRNNAKVLKYDPQTGAFVSVFVLTGSVGLSGPLDRAFKPSAAPANVPALSDEGAALLLGALLLAGAGGLRRLAHAMPSSGRSE